jgi:hypothetical protein
LVNAEQRGLLVLTRVLWCAAHLVVIRAIATLVWAGRKFQDCEVPTEAASDHGPFAPYQSGVSHSFAHRSGRDVQLHVVIVLVLTLLGLAFRNRGSLRLGLRNLGISILAWVWAGLLFAAQEDSPQFCRVGGSIFWLTSSGLVVVLLLAVNLPSVWFLRLIRARRRE